MSPSELLRTVKEGKFRPTYYLFGREDYRIVEARKFLASRFLPDKQIATNFIQLSGKTTPVKELLAALAAYPMLGEKQVVSVDDIQRYNKAEIDRILKLLDPPDPHRLVLFSTPSARMPDKKKSRFFKTISAATTTVEFLRLTPAETTGMVARKLSKEGLTIEPDALKLLVEHIGGNRGGLESEVTKLIDYRAGETTVSLADVRAIASGFEIYSVFDIADHIVAGNAEGALAHVRQLVAEGQSATGILFFIGQHYLSLYLVKNGKSLEPHRQWLARKFRPQAEMYSNEQLEAAISDIARADSAVRWQEFTPQIAVERLIVQLIDIGKSSGDHFRNNAGRKNAQNGTY